MRAICRASSLSGHPLFGAQVILNGHEYVRLRAARAGIACGVAGNASTRVPELRAIFGM